MEDKIGFLFFCAVVYLGLVLISILILTDIPREFEQTPQLINRRWKRILWALSCIFIVPLLMLAMRGPLFVCNEIENFIKNDHEGVNHNHGPKR